MAYQDPQLEELKNIARTAEQQEYHAAVTSDRFDEIFLQAIGDDNVKTIAMEFNLGTNILSLQIIRDHLRVTNYKIHNFTMSRETYEGFCHDTLKIDLDAHYNDSSNVIIKGRFARVFAIMPPYKPVPLIVISTVKNPPEKIATLGEREEKLLAEIINHSNVLIAGKSGSGKTYLLNYLLNKYMDKNKRIGIIQEFQEIISPNEFTDQMTTPPRKPDQTHNDLEFLTEQSNLMRYDLVIVGEIKGPEAWPFISNCASGTRGITTMHGTDADQCLRRLKGLCLRSEGNIDLVTDSIAKGIDYVVMIDDAKLQAISKVNQSTQMGTFQMEQLY